MKTLVNIIKHTLPLTIFFFLMNSCDSFVEIELPTSQLTNTAVFEDYATASAALTDVYAKIRDKGMLTGSSSGLSNELGNYTDEIVPYGTPSNKSLTFYNNSLLASNADILRYWNETYNQIFAVNAILEGINASKSLTSENKKQLQGEALFIRALLHFYLVNVFGDIPYITGTDYKKNSVVYKVPVKNVYEDIVVDLQKSITMLSEQYTTLTRVRPNKYVVKALLARVYLYNESYPEAANEASSILNQSELFTLEQDPNDVFLLTSKETIWQLQSATSGQNTQEGAAFIFISGPPPLVALNDLLVNSFAPSDLRLSHWIKVISNNTGIWYHASKYKQQEFTSISLEYSIMFRLAEQYLIRAEARVAQGDLIGAKEDLNKIRQRAGLDQTIAQSQQEILTAILQERRWEFFTEFGHRFFDLKRFKELDNALSGIKPGWNTSDSVFPLPQSELSANPNLRPQNQGY